MLIPIFQRGHSHQLFKFAGEIIAVRITASDGNLRYRKISAAKKPGGRTDAKGVEIFQGAGAVNIVEYPAEMTGGHTGHGGKILNRDIFTEMVLHICCCIGKGHGIVIWFPAVIAGDPGQRGDHLKKKPACHALKTGWVRNIFMVDPGDHMVKFLKAFRREMET